MDANIALHGGSNECDLIKFPYSNLDDNTINNNIVPAGKKHEPDQKKLFDLEYPPSKKNDGQLEDNISFSQNTPLMNDNTIQINGDCEKLIELPVQNNIYELPLDVQIQEPHEKEDAEDKERVEDEDSEGFEGLPIKVELTDSGNECDQEPFHLPMDEGGSIKGDVKAEPLEENYVDRINTLLEAVSASDFEILRPKINEEYGSNDGDGTTNEGHFLTVQARPKRTHRGVFKCPNCSASFKYQSTYDYHVKSQCGTRMIAESNKLVYKGKNQAFTCNVCHKEMCSRTSLMVHMRIHNGERPFVCDVCNRSFTQKAHLKDHVKIHITKPAKPLVYTCVECGEVFNAKKYLQDHMQVHFGNKIYDCEVCHKRFRTRSNLSTHKLIHSNKKEFGCTICGKEFLRRPNLDEHMRIHTKEKPFICDICGKAFAEKNRRNTHVKRHTGELRQVCSVCGKKFACSYDLRIHQRMHTGEKPFSCNICGRIFNRKAIMETHMTIHTGRKDFVCMQCGEAFNRKSKLDVHLADHTGEKFYCEICHKVFKCKAYLVPHVRTHFGGGRKRSSKKTNNCLLCHKVFKSSQKLQHHLKEKHPTLFETNFIKVEPLEGEVQ